MLTVPSGMQPIKIKIWGFLNVLASDYYKLSVYDDTYLVATN